jgi:D-glycero-D-manno-heptose 1,7-bisphosphate phosphatase
MQSPASVTRSLSRRTVLSKSKLENKLSYRKKHQLLQAVFIDRDGTINAERGYLLDPNELELNPTAGDAIHDLNDLGTLVIVITNQAAIDKKLLSVKQFEKINEKLWAELANKGAHYDALYFCPHSPEITPGCDCRKPKPGLILQAAHDFNINLSSSFMIGDKLSDIEAGQKAGCKTILVLTGRGEQSQNELRHYSGQPPDAICQNLADAVKWIAQTAKT